MSRLGKKPIAIPEKTEVTFSDHVLSVKGPLGELSRPILPEVGITIADGTVTVTPEKKTKQAQALWGTYASHLQNMIDGVNKVFEKKLVIEGVGYRWSMAGNTIELGLGFSHPVKVEVPEGLKVEVEKSNMTISGIDKDLVGKFAAEVRALKKPEPYKGKGIRYEDEVIRRKQGKKNV